MSHHLVYHISLFHSIMLTDYSLTANVMSRHSVILSKLFLHMPLRGRLQILSAHFLSLNYYYKINTLHANSDSQAIILSFYFISLTFHTCSNHISCTPDREILRFTPCEKFLSHPRYLTPVAPCIQVFFF